LALRLRFTRRIGVCDWPSLPVQILTLATHFTDTLWESHWRPSATLSFRQFLAKSDESFAEKVLNHFAAKQCEFQTEHLTAQIK